jgi:hypothetical protein
MMRSQYWLAAMVVVLSLSPLAMAQAPVVIDKAYESAKAAELASVRLQLSTSSGSVAIVELNEAESALRQLHETKGREQRAKIATELESALARLHLEADRVELRK